MARHGRSPPSPPPPWLGKLPVAVNAAMEFQHVSVANDAVYKGLDDWLVGFGIGRKLTFKSFARRVVMTKFTNTDEISLHDAAKHVGVVPRTLNVYHEKGRGLIRLLCTFEGVRHAFKHLIVCYTLLTRWGCKSCLTIFIMTFCK